MEKVNNTQASRISFSSEISPNSKVKNRRKITLIAGAIILTLASGVGSFILGKNLSISLKKNQSQEAKPTILPNNISREKPICASLDLPEHKVVDNFSIDLDKDKENEIVRIYAPHMGMNEDNCGADLPIVVKIFSKATEEENCYKEEFVYPETLTPISNGFDDKRYNSYESAQVMKNFWGEEQDAVLVSVNLNFCGGSRRQLLLFTHQNGEYLKIDGPIFNELAFYFLSSPPEGKTILVVHGKREAEELHFGAHRYTFILYKWDGQEYKEAELGTTKNKYDPADENFKTIFQNIRMTFQNEPEKLPLEIEKL